MILNGPVLQLSAGLYPAYRQLLFNAGLNTLTVQALTATGNEPTTPPDQYYVNWAELTYARRYVADANRLAFGADTSGGTTFEVSGFSEPEIMVFDVSQPTAPVLLTETSISTEDDVSRVRFEANVENSSAFYAAHSRFFFDA